MMQVRDPSFRVKSLGFSCQSDDFPSDLSPKIQGPTKTSAKWEWIFPGHFWRIRDPWGLIKKNLNCWERQVDLVGIAMFCLVFAKGFER